MEPGELAVSFRTVRATLIQIAEEIPESQYEFCPAPEVRPVGKLLFHISQVSAVTLTRIKTRSRTWPTSPSWTSWAGCARKSQTPTKDEIVAALKTEGEKFATFLEGLSEPLLGEIVTMMPGSQPATKSRLELILSAKEHEMHHRGQLMLIERMLGVVPHLTRRVSAAHGRETGGRQDLNACSRFSPKAMGLSARAQAEQPARLVHAAQGSARRAAAQADARCRRATWPSSSARLRRNCRLVPSRSFASTRDTRFSSDKTPVQDQRRRGLSAP